ncbi:prolipoprotein diacylglyceryl transferase, putative [Heliomicrobium modesticaldum Ice1]|uniref:Prolipoprotein diacylglyceryl transferase, putative n=1 Tax=Heliobacterium modesticaldum (strain ATCC 51547 / Ice1) TaxID=498761 RepID=B0TB42_HELMI|nr:prolipoprotein diacylglyceryl transferase family protein [Heliomicrobium modesticaldum]ABZ83769.1 prolipoprotein diacylglyceryl transferase, putative [Heliomicrobium modesticaldum Ice1]
MWPVLWRWGSGADAVGVRAYPFFMIIAALIALVGSYRLACRKDFPKSRVLATLAVMALSVPVGARMLNLWLRPDLYQGNPAQVFSLEPTGFSLYGGLLLAAITGTLACRILKLPLLQLADSTAPPLGLAIAMMRLGCFSAGCCFGNVTDLSWGVIFPLFSLAHRAQIRDGMVTGLFSSPLPVHPTQLYELIGALLASALAYWLWRRKMHDGTAFAAFVLLFTSFRWANRSFRYEALQALPPSFYPALYMTILIVSGTYLVLRKRADDG